jgi:hypothetical protein
MKRYSDTHKISLHANTFEQIYLAATAALSHSVHRLATGRMSGRQTSSLRNVNKCQYSISSR